MRLIRVFIFTVLLSFAVNAQGEKTNLPIIKSNADVVRYEDGADKNGSWTLNAELKPDIYDTQVKIGQKKKVTFITDLDKISFDVEAGKSYDFIIQKGGVFYYTQIKAGELKFWNDQDFWESPAMKSAYKPNLSDDEKIAGLSKLWSEAKYNFVNFDLVTDIDWDAVYLSYLPKIRETKTTLEYYRLLIEMGAKLRDGHTNVYVPNELSNDIYSRPLIRTRLYEDKVLIYRVLDQSLVQNGITAGQEITEIDGVSVKKYAEEYVKPFQSASTVQDLENRMYESMLLAGSSNNQVILTLGDAQGKTFKTTLPRVTSAERAKKNPSVPSFEYKMLPGNIAYVALNSFGDNSAAEQFAKNYSEISKAEAIIFDVRENGGGNSGVGWNILGYLTDKDFPTSKWYTRDYRASFRAWNRSQETYGQNGIWKANGKDLYTKPVIVLTSPRTFSAAEDFTLTFDILKRGVIIGEPTGGSSGQPLSFTLPGGGSARVCTKRDQYPDGRDFVGKGIVPNKLIKPTVADFRAGKDTVLEAALSEIKK